MEGDHECASQFTQRTFEEVSLDSESSWSSEISSANHENFEKDGSQLAEVRIRRKDSNSLCESLRGLPGDSSMVYAYIQSRDISLVSDMGELGTPCPECISQPKN